jgi:hypothetical protein
LAGAVQTAWMLIALQTAPSRSQLPNRIAALRLLAKVTASAGRSAVPRRSELAPIAASTLSTVA